MTAFLVLAGIVLLVWLSIPRATGDILPVHSSSANATVTSVDGLAASATHVAGAEIASIDSSGMLDCSVDAKITVESAGLTAGEIRLWLVRRLDDSTWPDVFDGTHSTETVTDTEIRDAICRLAAVTVTDTTASRVYYLSIPSVKAVFGGNMPSAFVIFITQSTVAALETSGNQITSKGNYLNVAS